MFDNLIFWVFAVAAVGSALGVVFHKSIIYAALFLIVVFMSIAAFFLLNNADFLAISQMIVYGVGLTIVLLFGIMFTGDRTFKDTRVPTGHKIMYGIVAVFALALLVRAAMFDFSILPASPNTIAILQNVGSTQMLGELLFTRYALPFEAASVLLLVAMIGAIVISRKTLVDAEIGTGEPMYTFDKGLSVTAEAEAILKEQIEDGSIREQSDSELTGVR